MLGVFLAGLAGGAAIAGRRAGRIARPLRVYALLEAAIGGLALLAPALAAAARGIVATLGPGVADGPPLVLLRAGAAALVLLPPTLCMGATFPVLVRAWSQPDGGRGTALLYGWNTLGAACGALGGSFAALPLLGTRGTFWCAGAINLAVAGMAWLVRVPPAPGAAAAPAGPAASGGSSPTSAAAASARIAAPPGLLLLLAAYSGCLGAVSQVGWTRVMTLAFGSSVYALGLTLGAVILGLGLGPLVAARFCSPAGDAAERALRTASQSAWLVGAASLALLPVLGDVPALAARLSGLYERAPISALLLLFGVAGGLLVVPAMAQGAILPLLSAACATRRGIERAAGSVYAASTTGAVLGFLLAGFALLPWLGTRWTLAGTAIDALLLAFLLWAIGPAAVRSRREGRRSAAVEHAGALAAAAVPILLLLLPAWDAPSMSAGGLLYGGIYRASGAAGFAEAVRRRGKVLYERDGGDGLVTVRLNAAGILSLQINGKTEASSGADMATQLLAGHLPMLVWAGARGVRPFATEPRDALVIGLASGVTLGAVARHPVKSLEVVEISRAVPGAARLFDEVNGRVLDDPRSVLVLDDARAWLLARPREWDVIVSQPSNPWVAGVAGLFTSDMYRLLRDRLRPEGVVAQWVQAYRIAPDDLRGIVASFLEVFPDATLWEESPGGGDLFLVGGTGDRKLDPKGLAAVPDAVWTDLKRAGIGGPADLLARFVAGPGGLRSFASGARRHTDDDLYLEWRAPLALLRDAPIVPALLRREREPVAAILTPGALTIDPDLAVALRARLRRRDERIAAAANLREADLMALREPGLAAGMALLANGRYVEAAAALAAAAAPGSGSATAQFLLGEAYRGAGLAAAAAIAYEAAVAIDPVLADAWNALGIVHLAAGRTDEARHAFETAVRTGPGLAAAHNNLGSVLLREGDAEAAERELRAALAIDPDLAAAHANLGLVARRRGDDAGAEREYRRAIDADPLNLDARFNLAVVLEQTGREDEARAILRTILAADPSDRDARAALARLGVVE